MGGWGGGGDGEVHKQIYRGDWLKGGGGPWAICRFKRGGGVFKGFDTPMHTADEGVLLYTLSLHLFVLDMHAKQKTRF